MFTARGLEVADEEQGACRNDNDDLSIGERLTRYNRNYKEGYAILRIRKGSAKH